MGAAQAAIGLRRGGETTDVMLVTTTRHGLDPIVAIIPARGGSKGLPGKNLRLLGGVPLVGHAIRCAQGCARVSRVVVSTDDAEIAARALALGAEVPFRRPADLATDTAPTMPVLQHALAALEAEDGPRPQSLLLLEPTSPGRLPDDLDRAIALLESSPDADGVVACSEPHFNPYYVGVVERDGYLAPALPRPVALTRRQDAPRLLRINGALYLWRSSFVRTAPADWTAGRHLALEIPEARALSIDDQHEFELAEAMIDRGLLHLPWLPRGRQT